MSKKKMIKEAGSYNNLTPEEKKQLSEAPPEIRNSVASVVSSLRGKGKQIDLLTAARQMQQIDHFKGDPNIGKFIAQLSFGANAMKGGSAPKVAPPPQSIMQNALPPKIEGPTAGDRFEQLRQSKTTNNDEVLAQQRAAQSQSSFDRARQLRAQRNAKVAPPAAPVNPLAATQPVSPQQQQQLQQMQRRNRPVAEAINPAAMMTGALRNILGAVSKMKPEELMAIAQLVNSLLNSKGSASSAGATMESRKMVTETIKSKLVEQIQARNTAEKLLTEGPMGNIWDKIKGAGTALSQTAGLAGQMGQKAQAVGVDENAKKAAQELTKVIGKVNQHRQKFNSSILKNSEAMNSYHDLVLNAVQMYQQSQNVLGPFGQQIVRQIHDAVGNLVYDLKSEQEQIDAFLKQLKDAGMAKVDGSVKQTTLDPTLLGAQAKKKAQASRVEENPGAVSSARRAAPMGGGKIDPKFGDDLEKSQALAKAKLGNKYGDVGTTQKAMSDLQKLFVKQIQREKEKNSGKK